MSIYVVTETHWNDQAVLPLLTIWTKSHVVATKEEAEELVTTLTLKEAVDYLQRHYLPLAADRGYMNSDGTPNRAALEKDLDDLSDLFPFGIDIEEHACPH